MAKLTYRWGTMCASKSMLAISVCINYESRGQRALLVKPRIEDDRGAPRMVKSRSGIKRPCIYIDELLAIHDTDLKASTDAIIVDEAQFLTPQEVDALSDIVDFLDIPIIAFGLRTDFKMNAFPGSARFFEIADAIEEIPSVCWCGKKARVNARVVNGEIVTDGEQVMPGGDDMYVTLCRKHFKERRLHG